MSDYENEKTFSSRYLNDVYPVAPEKIKEAEQRGEMGQDDPEWKFACKNCGNALAPHRVLGYWCSNYEQGEKFADGSSEEEPEPIVAQPLPAATLKYEMEKGLHCLYLAANPEVVDDLKKRVMAYVEALEAQLSRLGTGHGNITSPDDLCVANCPQCYVLNKNLHLLVKLWDKAVGTPDYVKTEWIHFQHQILGLLTELAVLRGEDCEKDDAGPCGICTKCCRRYRAELERKNAN